ncbi:MAG TPA: carboxymuconolactone decarboxylase family protein [Alphaproteobacteria bacterium]|jgi:alkylhydroperoxidase family enzyme|nr:carboxymuconolactone decarboxylase family protein [Alphaproteobacteria bacterium]
MSARIAPAEPPFVPAVAERLERIMPPGMPPLTLFTTLARNQRVFERLMAGGLLDPGSLSLRQRELMIDRTCARCGCGYEWGVHVALFADRVGLGPAEIEALATAAPEDGPWEAAERALLALADALHDGAAIPDALWAALSEYYSNEQLIELIALAGYYHLIAFMANGLRLPAERFAPPLPPA